MILRIMMSNLFLVLEHECLLIRFDEQVPHLLNGVRCSTS